MKYSVVAISLAALSAGAVAQEPASAWEFFEQEGGRSGALVKSANGSQLVIKCDKPGRREVHAMILSAADKLAVPMSRPLSRPITFQFDSAAPKTENWGFYEQHAIAQGKTSDRALARFVAGLRGSSSVKMRLDTGVGRDVDLDFNVTGSEAAVARVYESCKDSAPS